jgi:UDP-2-acetamido-2,6-beta-L-arabino-hexul-4-ose reductase
MIQTTKLSRHKDKRGDLLANTNEEMMLATKHFFVSRSNPGAVRGNHYHKHKTEWFLVIKGECEIVVEDMNTKIQESIKVSDKDDSLVSMEPGKAHAIRNIGSDELILFAFVNEVLDQNDPDTFPYTVL